MKSLYSYLKQKCLFSKTKDRKENRSCLGVRYQWEQEGCKESVEGE
jgi:hypothetical protein